MKFVLMVDVQSDRKTIKGKAMQAVIDCLKREGIERFDVSYYPNKHKIEHGAKD